MANQGKKTTTYKMIKVFLTAEDKAALEKWAEREYRPIYDQIAFIVRERLEAEGLVEPWPPQEEVVITGDN